MKGMKRMDLISVIVPVYKVEPYLDRCVKSIVNQTYTNLEIILVDDGSPDRCPQMCDQWAEKDARIRVIHKQNGGLSDARNAGMQIASGEYVAFVDSDDWIDRVFIEKLYTIAQETRCEVVGCAICNTNSETPQDLNRHQNAVRVVGRLDAVSELINDTIRQVVWNKLYKRLLIQDILFAVGKLHEDEFWSYQVLGRAERYAETEYTGYYYFQRPESIMGKAYSLRRLDALEAKINRQAYLEKHLPQLTDQGQINLFFTCIYCGQMSLKYLNKVDRKAAFVILNRVSKAWRLSVKQKKTLKGTHWVWAAMAELSLFAVCRIRNMLSVGI